MTNNIANCCENTSSNAPLPNDSAVMASNTTVDATSNVGNNEENSMIHPIGSINHENGNFNNNNLHHQQQQQNGHLIQINSIDDVDDVDVEIRSPYESTTMNNKRLSNAINFTSKQPSSSPPPLLQPFKDHDQGPKCTKSLLPCLSSDSSSSSSTSNSNSSTSLWKILHMISVVISSATINGVVFGVVNNFGVFYDYLTELSKKDMASLGFNEEVLLMTEISQNENITIIKNNANRTTSDPVVQSIIAGIGSFNVGLIFFCSIFASVLCDRYGIRSVCFIGGILATIGMYASSVSLNWIYLYVTYGLVLGIGASLVYGPSLAILGHYFTKRLGLVNGLVTAGSSAFSIIMPIMLRWLLDLVGIQVTFKYLSILIATLILCSLSFKEQIKKPASMNGSAKKNLANMFFYDALWKNNLYLYWVISIPLGLFGYFVPFCHLVKHAREINSYYQGEVLVMSIGLTSMIGRLITGPLADFSHINRICLQQIAFASIGTLTIFLPFVRDLPLLLVCCGLGLFDGCFISLLGPIAFDLVGPEYANQAIGLLLCFCSLPLTTGPPIAAYAYGIYGNYKLAFCLAGIPPIFAALLMFNIIRMQRLQRRRTSTIKLGIEEPRGVFEEVLIVNHNNQNKPIGINGEKLHLLINGNDSSPHHNPNKHHHTGINGTTKLNLSSNGNEDNHLNSEKTGLLLNNGAENNGPIVILPKDHHPSSSSTANSRKSSLKTQGF